MISDITIDAEVRARLGKGNARQLRQQGKIPVTLYGGDTQQPLSLAVSQRALRSIFRSASGRNTIFNLKTNDHLTPVIIKDWQVDPLKGSLLHVDLLRIDMSKPTRVRVPIVLEGEAIGVKVHGGLLDFMTHEVEVECLPGDIPDRIHVNVSHLDVGDHIFVKDLQVGDKVRIIEEMDRMIVGILASRREEVATVAMQAEPAEPEVIKKGKTAEEETANP